MGNGKTLKNDKLMPLQRDTGMGVGVVYVMSCRLDVEKVGGDNNVYLLPLIISYVSYHIKYSSSGTQGKRVSRSSTLI